MATTKTNETFHDMLNEYLPNKLLREELIKRDYVLTRVAKDNNWKGGSIIVPFKAAGASSVAFGNLTDAADISEASFVRGSIDTPVEVWGTLIFNHADIMKQDKVSAQNFLSVLPDTIEDFMQHMKEVVSNQLTCGPHFAAVTDATNGATGVFIVDRIEKFMIGQKVMIDDDNSSAIAAYVQAIDINTSTITINVTSRAATTDFTGLTDYIVAQNAKFYYPGTTEALNQFVSLKSALLSLANGGSTNLHGKAKTAYPFLQAVNIDGSAWDATNFMEKLFEGYVDVRRKARGQADEVLMSYKNFGTCMKLLEISKGGYKVTEGSRKASMYGWVTIEVQVVASSETLKLVGIQEMDDDVVMYMDWSGFTFRSNGFFKKRMSPEGNQYFEVRAVTGYAYIVDTCLFGQLECRTAGKCGIVHTIAY